MSNCDRTKCDGLALAQTKASREPRGHRSRNPVPESEQVDRQSPRRSHRPEDWVVSWAEPSSMQPRAAHEGSMALENPTPVLCDNGVSIGLLDAIELHCGGWVSVTFAVTLMSVCKFHRGPLACQWFLLWTCQADHIMGLLHVIGPHC